MQWDITSTLDICTKGKWNWKANISTYLFKICFYLAAMHTGSYPLVGWNSKLLFGVCCCNALTVWAITANLDIYYQHYGKTMFCYWPYSLSLYLVSGPCPEGWMCTKYTNCSQFDGYINRGGLFADLRCSSDNLSWICCDPSGQFSEFGTDLTGQLYFLLPICIIYLFFRLWRRLRSFMNWNDLLIDQLLLSWYCSK